jgi:putative transposase
LNIEGKKSSAVYNINYHIVWCPKFRKPILVDKVKEFVEEQLETIAQTKGYKILEARVMPDRIHLFIDADPFNSPTNIFQSYFKGLRMSRKFADVGSKLWRGVIWSPSYYVGTAGHLSAETIERYIRDQQTEWKRSSSTG